MGSEIYHKGCETFEMPMCTMESTIKYFSIRATDRLDGWAYDGWEVEDTGGNPILMGFFCRNCGTEISEDNAEQSGKIMWDKTKA